MGLTDLAVEEVTIAVSEFPDSSIATSSTSSMTTSGEGATIVKFDLGVDPLPLAEGFDFLVLR